MTGSPTVDLIDQYIWEKGVPYDTFAALRRHDPVYWHPEPDGPGFWAVTRHADVKRISNDPGRFSSYAAGVTRVDLTDPVDLASYRSILIAMDPPNHRDFRGLVSAVFTPRAVQRLEGAIREIARQAMHRALEKGRIDFVTDYAALVPVETISAMMGVPPERRSRLMELSAGLVDDQDPEVAPTPDYRAQASAEVYVLAQELAAVERARPGDNLTGRLLCAEVGGRRLTDHEFNLFFLFLIVAGNETTRTVSSGGLATLLANPDQLAALRAEPALMPSAVEEIVRYWPPIHYMRRTATCDVELGGKTIRKGEKLLMWYPSANRDERVFVDPDRFDVRRPGNEQLSFGFGEHFCLGASLARLELRVMFEELLAHTRDIVALAPPRRLRSNLIHGVKEFRVELRSS